MIYNYSYKRGPCEQNGRVIPPNRSWPEFLLPPIPPPSLLGIQPLNKKPTLKKDYRDYIQIETLLLNEHSLNSFLKISIKT